MFGQPTELAVATLGTPKGNATLLMGGKPHAKKLKTSDIATAIRLHGEKEGKTPPFGQAELGAALQAFWDGREKLSQPMNVALKALHLENDMHWRLFAVLPTLDRVLKPEQTPESIKLNQSRDTFLQLVATDDAASNFCKNYMKELPAARLPTFAMKLSYVLDRMRAAGWNLPEDTENNIKRLRNDLAHTATSDKTPRDQLWPLMTASVAILIFLTCERLGIPIENVRTDMASNFGAIGQAIKS